MNSRKYQAPFSNTSLDSRSAIDRALRHRMVYLVMYRRYNDAARPPDFMNSRGTFVVRAMTGSKAEIRRRAADFLQIPEIDITVL